MVMNIWRERLTWAWSDWPVAVIDFETTSADPTECRPVEVAIVRFERGVPVGSWSSLLFPGMPIPAEATAIHGITDDMVKDAPGVASQMMQTIRVQAGELLRDAAPCGYNGQSFDRVILHRFAYDDETSPATCRNVPWIDPLVVIRDVDRFERGAGRHKLTAACARHGVTLDGAHRATADAEACGRLLFALKERIGSMTLGELLRRQQARAAVQERDFQNWLAQQPKREAETKQPEGAAS